LPAPGARIAHYEVVALIGRGGMGEVYRARDTRLQREVAIKLLPESFSTDPERLARFNREAQLLAALNHPHIAAIYGVEEQPGSAALVLELVEGPTLADRLARSSIPADEAIGIALQIATALEAAHEQGIIHRDLKPANIKLRPDGTVKVLDFGLARADVPSPADAALSPTLTAQGTAPGLILGTAAYMSPEQARGRGVDRRADIWAFGVVLFEMLTRQRPFGGETISETLAAIIKDRPSWTALPEGLPSRLTELLERTLEKNPRRRLRDIGDARIILEDLQSGTAPAISETAPRLPRAIWRRLVPWTIASVATLAAVAMGWRAFTPRPTPTVPALKYTLPISGDSLERTALPTISPDGRHVAFARAGTLWVRPLDQLEARQLTGTNGAQFPFWSPDSRQVAYLTANALWRVALDGSPPVRVANYRFSKGGRTPGGVWLANDTIVFARAAIGSGLLSVPAQGGEFSEYYKQDSSFENDFHRPSVLPDGRSLVFVVDRLDTGADTIGVLVDGKRKDILRIEKETLDSPIYSPTGHLLYQRETATPGLWALPFSLERMEATGAPFLVAPQASYPSIGANGTLIYIDGSLSGLSALAWVDVKTGHAEIAFNEQFPIISNPRLSPDGTRVAAIVQTGDEGQSVIVGDLRRHTHVRLRTQANVATRLAWRDERTVIYEGSRELLMMRNADGSGEEVVLTAGMQPYVAAGRLLFSKLGPTTHGDLFQLLLPPGTSAPAAAELIQQSAVNEWSPALSPDGTLLAYSSGDTGQSEVILRTYPTQTAQWQVSSTGGGFPEWSPRGDAIYYREIAGQILRVEVRRNPAVTLGAPTPVARPSNLIARAGFDVSRDGTKLLMVQELTTDQQRAAGLAVVQNWLATVER
jgi:serine/threonine-protein kinase